MPQRPLFAFAHLATCAGQSAEYPARRGSWRINAAIAGPKGGSGRGLGSKSLAKHISLICRLPKKMAKLGFPRCSSAIATGTFLAPTLRHPKVSLARDAAKFCPGFGHQTRRVLCFGRIPKPKICQRLLFGSPKGTNQKGHQVPKPPRMDCKNTNF